MPSLKDLTCTIEVAGTQEPLPEHGTVYGDALVSTLISVPQKAQPFTVHLTSQSFIAPGIAMYVFIDGVYQCNRNRQDLKLRRPLDRRALVDFRVRQKEERQDDGSMIAREWTFGMFDHNGAPEACSPGVLEKTTCIEVVVLRCAGARNAKTAANMNLDGAADYHDYRFDSDSRSRKTAFDDRGPPIPIDSNTGFPHEPFYRSPYAETVQSLGGAVRQGLREPNHGGEKSLHSSGKLSKKTYSRYSEPVSPGTRPQRHIPAPGFQYGSGPLPSRTRIESRQSEISEESPSVSPEMFEKIVADAVKRGLEESRKGRSDGRRTEGRRDEDSSEVPGAWPASPTRASREYADSRTRRWSRSRARTRVAWDEEPEWDKQSRADGWDSADDHPGESWDTHETWSRKRPDGWEDVHLRSRSRSRSVRTSSPRRTDPIPGRGPRRGRFSASRSSQRTDEAPWSSEDSDGWSRIEARSASSTSVERSDSMLKPSRSRSQTVASQRKRVRRRSVRAGHRRPPQLSTHLEHHHPPPPSVVVTNAPTLPWESVPQGSDAPSRRQSAHSPLPPPAWGSTSTRRLKNSAAPTTPHAPPPFSTLSPARREASTASTWPWGAKDTHRTAENGTANHCASSVSREGATAWSDADTSLEASQRWGSGGPAHTLTQKSSRRSAPHSTAVAHDWGTENDDNNNNNNNKKGKDDGSPAPHASVRNADPSRRAFPPTSTQRLAGPGTAYGHAVGRPVYVDSLEKPFAVFRFGWRRDQDRAQREREREREGWVEEWVVRQRRGGGIRSSDLREK